VLGTWGAVVLWAISAGVGMLQTWIYAESAAMFPDKPGGISLYAHEGWRGRFSLAGPIGAFGYWIGWSVVLSIFGKIIGDLIQAQWFPNTTWSVFSGTVHLGLPHFIALGTIIVVWLLNVFGIRPAVWISYVTGAGLMIPLFVVIVLPVFHRRLAQLQHDLEPARLARLQDGDGLPVPHGLVGLRRRGLRDLRPEYKDTKRDTTIALRSAAVFTLVVYLLFPLGLGGVTGAPPAATAEGQFYVAAFDKIVGNGVGQVMLVLLIGSLFLSMISSTATARAPCMASRATT
jgi:amino acid transporter